MKEVVLKRDQAIDKAKELVNGDRAKDYGDAYNNHSRIAEGWNIIMRAALRDRGYLTERHVCLMMDWVKTARLLNCLDHEDSWVDKIGYSSLGAEFTEEEAELQERLNVQLDNSSFRRTVNKSD